ncbi:MAG: hypothetical protein H6539_03200 [Bacteroidales bacterium]|nr:hypothetical protein [Bacteroidales bacterium]
MKSGSRILLISLFYSMAGFGQLPGSKPGIGLMELSQVNQGNSYATFPTDIGNIEPLWFEVNLVPNFYLRASKNARLLGVLTPQIILRMYKERSCPVRTPSYLPQITVYYILKELGDGRKLSTFGRFAHHSNGQEGDFFGENGEINLKTGDFATNFLETGLIINKINSQFNAYQFFRTSIEIHPHIWSAIELDGIYSKIRWHNIFSIYKLPVRTDQNTKKKVGISVKGESTWLFGELNNWNGTTLKRLNLSFTFYYHPKFLEDIGLFAQYFHGSDYYNLYFSHRLDILRFGLMTEKIRF